MATIDSSSIMHVQYTLIRRKILDTGLPLLSKTFLVGQSQSKSPPGPGTQCLDTESGQSQARSGESAGRAVFIRAANDPSDSQSQKRPLLYRAFSWLKAAFSKSS